MEHQLLAFVVVATLLTITPGMDMALITRNVLRSGLRAGWATSAGVLSGLVGWATLSVIGISALLAASAVAFSALKLAGGVYLVYLGLITLWHARGSPARSAAEDAVAPHQSSFRQCFRQGLVSNLLNPKVGLFYTTFLPQFVSGGRSTEFWIPLLAALHFAISVVWLAFFTWLVWQARRVANAPRPRRIIERVTGAVLVALGVRVVRQAA